MKHRVFDDKFKNMAVGLSRLKGSVKEAATELGPNPIFELTAPLAKIISMEEGLVLVTNNI